MVKKLLVLDDNNDIKGLFEAAGRIEGVEVVFFDSGSAALDYLNDNHGEVAAAIIDLSMPTLDGVTVAKELRRNEQINNLKPIQLAFFTARPIDAVLNRAKREVKANEIFQKPKDILEITREVKEWMQNVETADGK